METVVQGRVIVVVGPGVDFDCWHRVLSAV